MEHPYIIFFYYEPWKCAAEIWEIEMLWYEINKNQGTCTVIRNSLYIYSAYIFVSIQIYINEKNRKKGRRIPGLLKTHTARLGKVLLETQVKNWILKNRKDVDLWRGKEELICKVEKFQLRNSDIWAILNEHIYVVFAKISGPFNLMTQLFCVSISFVLCLFCFAI